MKRKWEKYGSARLRTAPLHPFFFSLSVLRESDGNTFGIRAVVQVLQPSNWGVGCPVFIPYWKVLLSWRPGCWLQNSGCVSILDTPLSHGHFGGSEWAQPWPAFPHNSQCSPCIFPALNEEGHGVGGSSGRHPLFLFHYWGMQCQIIPEKSHFCSANCFH